MTVDHVVNVITMRHAFMSAAFTVGVFGVVSFASMVCGAFTLVARINRKRTFVCVTFMHVMQMAVMNIIYMVAMFDDCVTAPFAVGMGVIVMCFAAH